MNASILLYSGEESCSYSWGERGEGEASWEVDSIVARREAGAGEEESEGSGSREGVACDSGLRA